MLINQCVQVPGVDMTNRKEIFFYVQTLDDAMIYFNAVGCPSSTPTANYQFGIGSGTNVWSTLRYTVIQYVYIDKSSELLVRLAVRTGRGVVN